MDRPEWAEKQMSKICFQDTQEVALQPVWISPKGVGLIVAEHLSEDLQPGTQEKCKTYGPL